MKSSLRRLPHLPPLPPSLLAGQKGREKNEESQEKLIDAEGRALYFRDKSDPLLVRRSAMSALIDRFLSITIAFCSLLGFAISAHGQMIECVLSTTTKVNGTYGSNYQPGDIVEVQTAALVGVDANYLNGGENFYLRLTLTPNVGMGIATTDGPQGIIAGGTGGLGPIGLSMEVPESDYPTMYGVYVECFYYDSAANKQIVGIDYAIFSTD
jgi:hypothetical protein